MLSFNLLTKEFLKFAGMLKAPEKLMREISEWAISAFATK
jgi:hypothetical protein